MNDSPARTDATLPDIASLRAAPPPPIVRPRLGRRLIRRALDKRDAEAARLVAEWMDADPALDATLSRFLDRALNSQPDAVYAFYRIIVAEDRAADERQRAVVWRERLKVAALAALRVAIVDGDAETALNWLRLVAREPAAYDLNEVFNAGVTAAQERAHEDPALARALVLLTAKRAPAMMDELLADDALRALLPDPLCQALSEGIGDPDSLFQQFGAEVFLAALFRSSAAHRDDTKLFTRGSVEQVWALWNGENGSAATAEKLVRMWASNGPLDWLPTDALGRLLTLLLIDKRDDLFYGLVNRSTDRGDFGQMLADSIAESGRTATEVLALTAQVMAAGHLDQQGAVDVYVGLLDAWAWDESFFSVVEQLARALQQHPEVTIGADALWRMVEAAGERKEDFEARTASRRLTAHFQDVEDDAVVADEVTRLFNIVHWNGVARTQILSWWRDYTHEVQIARLQRIDKALEKAGDGRRANDDLRAILQTTLAYRRMVGKRTMTEFAQDIATTFAILQALCDSFDPSAKRALQFDPVTLRAEIEARSEEIPSHERKILANNMKELGQLITTMADNRSKGSVVRRAEDVDRSLATGEQAPHSAVDALKWMAGYLSGSQQEADED